MKAMPRYDRAPRALLGTASSPPEADVASACLRNAIVIPSSRVEHGVRGIGPH